ncbi:hypothetical protein CAPTEDRAFT_191375 [Capitella teleta]|uniref:Inositol-pentakisphosphate 2-kinase n=1 Tax=Capitella teleta TaxID=283909 RepID=R7UFC2_CAPTE|nr:hypothetical protein CAPTEDRAFT_191375 [Capitella teleta]|eukprot:ELU02473.1 hypothetical protein CAPTEDRAFT_191375 [Capitella teleta]
MEDVDAWIYRAEGNSSIVIVNRDKRLVYRLKKRKCIGAKKRLKVDPIDVEQKWRNALEFKQKVITRLLQADVFTPGGLVTLTEEYLDQIRSKVENIRPDQRLNTELDPDCHVAIAMDDHCFLKTPAAIDNVPTFSAEIKLKCGFILPGSETCIFCLLQPLKVSRGKWASVSGYCPLDLFSGDEQRMTFALKELFRNPQNNLRIFQDGNLIFDQDKKVNIMQTLQGHFSALSNPQPSGQSDGLDTFIHLLIKCLLHQTKCLSASSPIPSSVCAGSKCPPHKNAGSLRPFCALHQILSVQRLSTRPVREILPHYHKLCSHFAVNLNAREKSEVDGPYHSDWLTEQKVPTELETSLLQVKEYLVSRSLRDCSVIVAMQAVHKQRETQDLPIGVFPIQTKDGAQYLCSTSVIDTDVKPFDRFLKWNNEEQEIDL